MYQKNTLLLPPTSSAYTRDSDTHTHTTVVIDRQIIIYILRRTIIIITLLSCGI